MRALAFCIAVALLAVVAAPTTAAVPEPVGVCDDSAIVEVCAPVCIQGPCHPYVCIHRGDDVCVRP